MKKYLIILLLTGCSLNHELVDIYYSNQFKDIAHSNTPKPSYGFLDKNPRMFLKRFLTYHIKPKEDITDRIQSPDETLLLGTGDCEDYSILYIDLMYLWFNVKCNLILVYVDRSSVNHVVIELPDGTLVEPQNNKTVHYNVEHRIKYDNLFK